MDADYLRKNGIRLAGGIVVSIFLILSDGMGWTAPVYSAGNYVLQPMEYWAHRTVGGMENFVRTVLEIGNLRTENSELRVENAELSSELGKLKEVDPTVAKKIHSNDLKKIIRALEVYELTGKTMTQLQEKGSYSKVQFEFVKAGLKLDRKELYQRINQRVDAMLIQGLLEEVKNLKNMGYSMGSNALNAVGYKELFSYLRGEINLKEAIKKIKQKTRNYAKRQMTWFKKEKDIAWFNADKDNLAEKIIKLFREDF